MQIVSPGVVDPDFRRPYSGLDEMISLLLQKFKLEVTAEAVRVEVHLPAQAVILNLGRGGQNIISFQQKKQKVRETKTWKQFVDGKKTIYILEVLKIISNNKF
jgi:hypothetical protein